MSGAVKVWEGYGPHQTCPQPGFSRVGFSNCIMLWRHVPIDLSMYPSMWCQQGLNSQHANNSQWIWCHRKWPIAKTLPLHYCGPVWKDCKKCWIFGPKVKNFTFNTILASQSVYAARKNASVYYTINLKALKLKMVKKIKHLGNWCITLTRLYFTKKHQSFVHFQ